MGKNQESTTRNPGLYEVMSNSDTGPVRRVIRRYLFTSNPERSVQIHKAIGTPILRKVIMGTVGRAIKPFSGGNYRLNERKGKMEAMANFAVHGSVFNEAWHTAVAIPQVTRFIGEIASGSPDIVTSSSMFMLLNLGCVAVQRYNRARIAGVLDRQLQAGREFEPGYTNWLGIDARAQQTAQDTVTQTDNSTIDVSSQFDQPFSGESNPSTSDQRVYYKRFQHEV